MNSFQCGMNSFQIRMNSFQMVMYSFSDRYSHTDCELIEITEVKLAMEAIRGQNWTD